MQKTKLPKVSLHPGLKENVAVGGTTSNSQPTRVEPIVSFSQPIEKRMVQSQRTRVRLPSTDWTIEGIQNEIREFAKRNGGSSQEERDASLAAAADYQDYYYRKVTAMFDARDAETSNGSVAVPLTLEKIIATAPTQPMLMNNGTDHGQNVTMPSTVNDELVEMAELGFNLRLQHGYDIGSMNGSPPRIPFHFAELDNNNSPPSPNLLNFDFNLDTPPQQQGRRPLGATENLGIGMGMNVKSKQNEVAMPLEMADIDDATLIQMANNMAEEMEPFPQDMHMENVHELLQVVENDHDGGVDELPEEDVVWMFARPCPECKEDFTTRQDMAKHIMGSHEEMRNQICVSCAIKFSSKRKYFKHLVIECSRKMVKIPKVVDDE